MWEEVMIGLRVVLTGVMMRSMVVTMSVSMDFHILGKIATGKKVEKLDCLSIAEVVDLDVEVASNDEFTRGGGCVGKKR